MDFGNVWIQRDKDVLEKLIKKEEFEKLNSILIIGGTGFIGFNVAKNFQKNMKF